MATIVRLVHPKRTVVSAQGRPADPASGRARIKLESLPAALSAVVSDVSSAGITIEADLPWLSVGTSVCANCPDGVEYTARVQSFDIDLTPSGSARLRIFAALSPDGQAVAAPRRDRGSRWRRLLIFGAFLAAAAVLSSIG
jgi:hypothetical protein